jgi:septum site-determining protein MinC
MISQSCPQGKLKNPRNVLQRAGLGANLQIKGTKSGLLLHLHERPLGGVVPELRQRLNAQPGFYQGSRAVLMLGAQPAESAELAAVIATLEQFGIVADGAVCDADEVAALARSAGLRLVGASIAASPRSRDDRTTAEGSVSPERSSGKRKNNGQAAAVGAGETLYHKGTVRSGQSLTSRGNIVIIGDVNAGAELIAAGDIVVWGALRGMAHAGAEGDESAKVFALRLEPMQLRISSKVAVAPDEHKRRRSATPEVARLRDGGIATEPSA